MQLDKRDDKASLVYPAQREGETVKAPCLWTHGSHFGAVREERNGSSPLPDG